jgi:hypothetical protein
MACNSITLSGVALDCSNVGGLSKIYIAPIVDVSGITVSATGTTASITMASGKTFKEFSFRKGNANFTSEGSRDDAAGTYFVTTTLTAQFNKMEAAKRVEMVNLVNAPAYVIALDNNGIYWLIGYGSYGTSSVSAASGAQRGEANAYTLTLTAETNELPYEVPSSQMSGLI